MYSHEIPKKIQLIIQYLKKDVFFYVFFYVL